MKSLPPLFAALALWFGISEVCRAADEWHIASAPLLTPWAEQVDSRNPLPDYPRPLMERKDWLNLNGVWHFQEARAGDAMPVNRKLNGYFTYDRKVEKLDRERVRKANLALWQDSPSVKETNIINPTDGGALNTPDEGAARRQRQ